MSLIEKSYLQGNVPDTPLLLPLLVVERGHILLVTFGHTNYTGLSILKSVIAKGNKYLKEDLAMQVAVE